MTRRSAEDEASFKGMGAAVRQLRRQAGLAQDALAKRSGLTVASLSRIEQGETEATWGDLRGIAEALNVPLGALIERAEELAPGPGGAQWRGRTHESRGSQRRGHVGSW